MAIIMIIVEFITIIKLLFSQPVGFTFFWFSSSLHQERGENVQVTAWYLVVGWV